MEKKIKVMFRKSIMSSSLVIVSMFALLAFGNAYAKGIRTAAITGAGKEVSVPAKKGPFRIGFSNGFSGNSWRAMALDALRNAAKNNPDVSELIVVDGQGDVTKQVGDIENLMAQNVDAIMVIPNSGTAVAPVLRKAMRAGIVTVPFNLPVEGGQYHAFIGTDPSKKGYATGKRLAVELPDNAKILAFDGIPGNSYTAAGWKGAQQAFKESGKNIEILAFEPCNWQEDKAKVIMADMIAAHPKIDGVWSDGGQCAAGAMKALIAANRPLIPVTGDDYNGILKLYDKYHAQHSNFSISLISEPTWQSVVAMEIAVSLLKGESMKAQQIIQPKLITSENYKELMRPELPDGVFTDTNLSDEALRKLF
ncbi:MAG: substrate-binding domain-containing protein [SAR324 cluster bacterium]|nr:substrate-binding domain-containing protein [SAR324 cluster bacterium]